MKRVVAGCRAANIASIRTLERLEMRRLPTDGNLLGGNCLCKGARGDWREHGQQDGGRALGDARAQLPVRTPLQRAGRVANILSLALNDREC